MVQSLTEASHLITSIGYANTYPETFAESSTSELGAAMDLARGGRFDSVPANSIV